MTGQQFGVGIRKRRILVFGTLAEFRHFFVFVAIVVIAFWESVCKIM